MFAVLIGSYARGDYNARSDCDVLLIDYKLTDLNKKLLPITDNVVASYIEYDEELFRHFYANGSLFLFHALYEGVLLDGDINAWEEFKSKFVVQKTFIKELIKIHELTCLLSNTEIFGGKYLSALSNAFTEIKNACIFYLAHNEIYEFRKDECFRKAIPSELYDYRIKDLKSFYDYSVRGIDVTLPFNPNSKQSESTLKIVHKIVSELKNDCK